MRPFVALVTLLFFATTGHTANVFIYDDDVDDELNDPNGHGVIGTEEAVVQALEALGHHPVLSQTLPATLSGYDIVFSLHGWYDC
jgi:hypothetical protein